jgi:hypothetical protein
MDLYTGIRGSSLWKGHSSCDKAYLDAVDSQLTYKKGEGVFDELE